MRTSVAPRSGSVRSGEELPPLEKPEGGGITEEELEEPEGVSGRLAGARKSLLLRCKGSEGGGGRKGAALAEGLVG